MNKSVLELFNQYLDDNYLEWYDTDQDGMDSMWYDQYLKFQRLSKLWDGGEGGERGGGGGRLGVEWEGEY